jgi:hypothetical protein
LGKTISDREKGGGGMALRPSGRHRGLPLSNVAMGCVAEVVAAAVVVRMGITWELRINERRDGNGGGGGSQNSSSTDTKKKKRKRQKQVSAKEWSGEVPVDSSGASAMRSLGR